MGLIKDKDKTLYIYCRVSTTKQDEDGISLDVQEERGLQVSKQLGLSSIVIKEQGSGLKPYLEERWLFTELMKSVSFGDVKHIWIDTDNRLTRHEVDEPFIKNKLKSNNVKLYVGKDGKVKDLDDFGTRLVDMIRVMVNQDQIQEQVEKSIRSKVKLFNEGFYMSGSPPFGYKLIDKKLEIDKKESEWMKKIFNWYDNGETSYWIRNELFTNGVKSPRGNDWWELSKITKTLVNETYIGKTVYHDKTSGITHRNTSPIIIDKDIFKSVQKKVRFNKGQQNLKRKDYLLRGIIKCSDGKPMNCRGKNKTNKYELYRCNHNLRKYKGLESKPCEIVKSLRMDDVNEYVWDLLLNTLSMSHHYREEIKQDIIGHKGKPHYSKRSLNLKINKLSKEMMDLDDRKLDLEKRWYGGDINKKKFEILRDTIENKENQIEREIDKFKFQIQSLDKKSTWVNWLDIHFSRIDELRLVDEYEERRKWITKYIHEVLVLNYNKDSREHTLVIKFRLPLFNDNFVWKLNKDGSHKTDKWGRWIYEIMDGEKSPTNPFTYRKSLNGS